MHDEERPRGTENYCFYNVLCIRRDGGIAYREGVGRVHKALWDGKNAEIIDVMLG